ncbi:MAG: ABC transporter permease [Chloroflexi bacterium]|nr:ABC transporter permease [Chloroflexota bacterium]
MNDDALAILIIGTLTGAVRSAASVLFTTLGEIVSERAGVINLGMEGCMLAGACTGVMVAVTTGNPWLGVPAAAAAGAALALIHAVLVISRGANQLATGFAVMFFALGLTALLGRPYVGSNVPGIGHLEIPLLAQIPGVGRVLFQHDPLTYLSFLLALGLWAFLAYTRWGLGLRAVGESVQVAYASGLSPVLIRYLAVSAGGALAGIGGAQLSLAYTHAWVEGMTGGRGFIAVALVIFSLWHPLRAIAGALLFGGAVALQLQLQSRGSPISPYILDMAPYVLTLLVLLLLRETGARAMPAGLRAIFRGG